MINGETLAERAVRTAADAGLSPVIAVIMEAVLIDSLQKLGATVLLNRKSYQGLSSSIVVGVTAATGCDGVVLMACDQPTLTADHLRHLYAEPESICGSGYAGKIGIPAYFPASDFPKLLQLQGDTGARDLLRNARAVPNENLSYDIDTEADIAQLSSKLKCDAL
jgi:CTP:molybdopterin cytidylyltransferase MocA